MVLQPPTKTFWFIYVQPNNWQCDSDSNNFVQIAWYSHRYFININSKLSRALFVIKQVKLYLPKESLHTLYYSLLHPHITYGILAWGNAKANSLRKTQILQKRSLRTIHNKFNSQSDPLFKQSGFLKNIWLISNWGYGIHAWLCKWKITCVIEGCLQDEL